MNRTWAASTDTATVLRAVMRRVNHSRGGLSRDVAATTRLREGCARWKEPFMGVCRLATHTRPNKPYHTSCRCCGSGSYCHRLLSSDLVRRRSPASLNANPLNIQGLAFVSYGGIK